MGREQHLSGEQIAQLQDAEIEAVRASFRRQYDGARDEVCRCGSTNIEGFDEADEDGGVIDARVCVECGTSL